MSKELKEIYGAERVLKIKTFLEMIVYTDELSKVNLEYLMDNAEVLLYAIEQAERVQELEQENKQIKEAYQDRCDDIDGLLEHFNTSWEELIDE